MNDRTECVAKRRHPEWRLHKTRWRWLLDSLEGGDRYRQATYGSDSRGLPVRNLIRHKREYPDPREQSTSAYGVSGSAIGPDGSDPASVATDDDYELRRARTPVPTFVAEAVSRDVGKVFGRKPSREIPPSLADLAEWTEDVDGRGTSLSDWLEQDVGPVFLALGQIDLLFDHPVAPPDEVVRSRADETRLGLAGCVASYILPENLVWWRLDSSECRYLEALVRERLYDDDGKEACRYRHWTTEFSRLYDADGKPVGEPAPHGYGVVPILRVFDRRKPRSENVGQSRYEAIAERQREYYNRDSELILSDTIQAHPLLQGPEDYLSADSTIPVGPGWLLPKKKSTGGGSTSYEGFDVVEFPKDGAESIRLNKADIRDDVDRDAGMTKPAGSAGSGKGAVSQSGVSKQLDAVDGNDRLAGIAKSLAKLEQAALTGALIVLRDGRSARDLASEVAVAYPAAFNLSSLADLGDGLQSFQALLGAAGESPELETLALQQMARKLLPGHPDDTFELIDDQIRDAVEAAAERKEQAAESLPSPPAMPPAPPDPNQAPEPETDPSIDSSEADAADPTNQDRTIE